MKKVLILHTGGTIGMAPHQKGLKPIDIGDLFLRSVPEISRLARVEIEIVDNIDSSQVTPKHWGRWLQTLKKNFNLFDGFLITHGTDTMAYSGAAFSYALGTLNKPVVFTGSQRPLLQLAYSGCPEHS